MGGIYFLGLVLVLALIAGKGRTEQQWSEEHDQVSAGSENTYQATTTESTSQVPHSAERRMSLEDFFLNRNNQNSQPQQPEAPQVQEPVTQFQVQQPNPNSVLLVRDTQFPNPSGGLISRLLLARRMLRLRRIARRLAILPRMLRFGQRLRQGRQPLGLFSNRVGETYQEAYNPRDYVFGKNAFSFSNNTSNQEKDYRGDQQQQQSQGYVLEAEPYYNPINDAPYELYDDQSNIRGIDSYENEDLSLNSQNQQLNAINTHFGSNGQNVDNDRLNQQLLLRIQQLQNYQQSLQQQQPNYQQNNQQVYNHQQQNLLNQHHHQQQLLNQQQGPTLNNPSQHHQQQQLLNQHQSPTLSNPAQHHQQQLNPYQEPQTENEQQKVQDHQSQITHEQQLQLLREQQLQLEREKQLQQQLQRLQELQAQQAHFQQQQQQQNLQPNHATSNEPTQNYHQAQNHHQQQLGQQQNNGHQQSIPTANRDENTYGPSLGIENAGSNNLGSSANIIGVGVNVGIKPPAVDVQVTKPVSPIIQPLPPLVNPIASKPPAPVEEPLVPLGILPKPILNLKGRLFFGAEVGQGVGVKTGVGR